MNATPISLRSWLFAAALGAVAAAQGFPSVHGEPPRAVSTFDGVLFDRPGDGRLWAIGASYKASFGDDGLVYFPFLGSTAARNHPVRFALRAVRAGGRSLGLAADAVVVHAGTRVTFDRGPVREVYDLTADSIEQTFLIDDAPAGDVEVELAVTTDLATDTTRDGLRWVHPLGAVSYGSAYLVQAEGKTEIAAAFAGGVLCLRVPAAVRRSGAVVIDPIITTETFAPSQMAATTPDIAYDVDTDRWLVTWVRVFSASDHDVLAELRSADGTPVPGSLKFIDSTADSMSLPRVANLGSVDRFLVAMERVPQVTGQAYTVWGRTMDANSPFTISNAFEITPRSGENQNSVDVGGDPGVFGTRWTVVWVLGRTIYARQVSADGTLGNLIPIADTGGGQRSNPEISLSNGRGLNGSPGWCIVYAQQASTTDWDIWGATMAPNGTISRAPRLLAGGASVDLYPMVSSPSDDHSAGPLYMVSYERQLATGPEMIVQVVDRDLNTVVPEVNLSRRYGYSGIFCRVECDGVRFAAMSRTGTGGLGIGTLSLFGSDLVQHEPMQVVGTGDLPFLASKRSGGGGGIDFAFGYVRGDLTPSRIAIGLYEGRAPTGGFHRRSTGCGLGIAPSGRPALGETISFALTNVGADLSSLVLGAPIPAAPVCGGCRLGVDPAGPILSLPAPVSFTVPRLPMLVGVTIALQGFAVGSGSCPGGLRLSDTIDVGIQ